MADVKLTAAQRAVVEDHDGVLLVSAAAGSGKTKVLIDRLLARICDPVAPCNIDDFLVITYTNAAAAELRLKIAQALNDRLSKEPNNRHLQRQLSRIYLAEISTVHSFCSNLIRNYAHLLDIPGDFRMVEEAEAKVLQHKVLDKLLEQGYEEAADDFKLMVETFGYGRDDRNLPEAILMANRAMRCRADMEAWVRETLEALDISKYKDVIQTPWGDYIIREYRQFLLQQIERLADARKEMMYYPIIEEKYSELFEQNIQQMQEILGYETWDDFYNNQITSFGNLKPVRAPEDVAVKERLKNLRNKCWTDLKGWQKLLYAPSAELLTDLTQVMPGAQALIRYAEKFDKIYAQEKKKRKVLDFSDLEHLAIKLLTDRYTGKRTAVAREVAARYVEVMVDEYQDSNQVQEVIFEAVSQNGQNRFMVGDVKQSIYRFRLADPGLFLGKYESYPDHKEAKIGEPRKILLSENFRSRPEILSACNDVFRLVMRKQVGDLDYGDEEALKPGREFPPLPQTAVELHCLTSSDKENPADKRDLEAEFVANRIRRMLDEKTLVTDADGKSLRPVRAGDIVILMRAVSSNAAFYLRALEEKGIPAVCNRGGNLLDTSEIQIIVSMLQVIDNPHQDVPLLTVLASPVFGFTPDMLAQARIKHRKNDFYSAICAHGGEFVPFINLLAKLREAALWLPLHELVDMILQDTNMVSIFASMTDGVQRKKNILAFTSFVASFEMGGDRSLSQLLAYLKNLQDSGNLLPIPQEVAENAVTIMTIHKSKGLEFPVVFLADLSHMFNDSDMKDAILVDDELAVGCNHLDAERFVRYPTLAKKSIERKKKQQSVSEELRVLYVAMTRPKDMLIMTYYSKRLLSELSTLNSQLTMPLSDDLCASVNNPGKWILMAALCRTEAGALLTLVEGNDVASVRENPWLIQYHDLAAEADDTQSSETAVEAKKVSIDEQTVARINHQYAYRDVCQTPMKLTATQLKGRALDNEAANGAMSIGAKSAYQFRKAAFLKEELSAAEKGIATHLFMQFASYDKCTSYDVVSAELQRLVKDKFLTPQQAEAVRLDKILYFFQTDLGKWLLTADALKREFKFSVLVDAGAYIPGADGEKSMLQGVVDCFVLEEDGITIVDFKTDRVGNHPEQRAEYYRPQLEAYATALSRIYLIPVKKKILYFFDADRAVEL